MRKKDLAEIFEAVRRECGLSFADEIFVEPVPMRERGLVG